MNKEQRAEARFRYYSQPEFAKEVDLKALEFEKELRKLLFYVARELAMYGGAYLVAGGDSSRIFIIPPENIDTHEITSMPRSE